jgi:alpha-tubulin suppressor-like RCC1 family protein
MGNKQTQLIEDPVEDESKQKKIEKIYAVGSNIKGQLGMPEQIATYTANKIVKPQTLDYFQNTRIKQVACGGFYTLFLTRT